MCKAGTSGTTALAVDFGGSHASCAMVSGKDVVASASIQISDARRLADALPDLAAVLRDLLEKGPRCDGLAFSFCGIVDPAQGRILSTPKGKYDDAKEINLAAWSAAEFDLPFFIENDARMALLGEWYAGAAQGCDDVVMVTLGTGVGGAAMIGGRLLRGRHLQAGCMGGHIPAKFDGRPCTCGAIGCVEAEASGWALPAICREWPGFAASALSASRTLNFAALFEAAKAQDRVAREIRDRCLQVWGAGLVGLVHAYDPEMIVVGGAVMGSAGEIIPALSERVANHSWTPWGTVAVVPARLGNHAALLGAVPLLTGQC